MRGRLIAGKFELRSTVGRGGMGTVWEAYDVRLGRSVAVKLMAAKHLGSGKSRERFEQEARTLAKIRSPHVVQIYDCGVEDDSPYIVMELLEGEDLDARLGRSGPLSPAVVGDLLRQMAEGLNAAAPFKIVHRDLKPANVFLVRDAAGETVKLLDFGLAWMRKPEGGDSLSIMGTPAYMSPEQLHGDTPEPLNDLWSLGVMAYRALTGRMPFRAPELGLLISAICGEPIVPPSAIVEGLTPALDAFFERALAKSPSTRFQSVTELAEAFTAASKASTAAKILIVDDEPDMGRLLELRFRSQIRAQEYQFVGQALNGVEALDLLARHRDVDVILADINMPVMDGLTLLGRIPEHAPLARTIMVSAYGDMHNIRQAMNAGAFDFVTKPIDFGDLEATINKAIRVVDEHKQMVGSDEQNQTLRKLTNARIAARIATLGSSLALASEAGEGSVVFVRLVGFSELGRGRPPAELIRLINANLDVVVLEAEKLDGSVVSFRSDGVGLIYTGEAHVARALAACVRTARQVAQLATLAGPDSHYADRLAIGVAAGPIVSGCIGSHVCGRLGFTMLGPTVDEAIELACAAAGGEILVSGEIPGDGPPGFVFARPERRLDRRAGAQRLEWNECEAGGSPERDPTRATRLETEPFAEAAGSPSVKPVRELNEFSELVDLSTGWTLPV